jgi:hypothetical protein
LPIIMRAQGTAAINERRLDAYVAEAQRNWAEGEAEGR